MILCSLALYTTLLQQLPFYKKFLSLFVPVLIRKAASPENPLLELYVYRGRYQLATADAIYSDGAAYTPLKVAFRNLKHNLPAIKNVLVLGTGLASAVHVMKQTKNSPDFTLVEYDNVILKLAMELMPDYDGVITPICADAGKYMRSNGLKYDLLIVDIFKSRIVPDFVTTKEFLELCKSSINADGYFVMNYIIQQKEEWHRVDAILRSIFPRSYCIDNGINRIIIATV